MKIRIILTFLTLLSIFFFNNRYAKSENNLHPVVYEGRIVYIDNSGKIVLDDNYETKYELGHIGIEGYSNINFPIYVFPEYAYFSENKVTVRRTYGFWFIRLGDEYEVIDNQGRTIIKASDRFVGRFSNDLAVIKIPLKSFDYIYDEKYTYIDTTGKYILTADCDTTNKDLYYLQSIKSCIKTYKYAGDYSDGYSIVLADNKYNFIDKQGNLLSKDGYEDVKPFKNGLAPVKLGSKWGIINTKNEWVIRPQFIDLWNFNEGLARFYDGNHYGFIDESGKKVFEDKHSFVGDFSFGFAVLRIGDWEYSYLDKTGQIIQLNNLKNVTNANEQFTNQNYVLASSFYDGYARVMVNGKWGFIDTNFNFVVNAKYDFASDYREGFAYVWLENKVMIINKKQEIIWTYQFDKE